GAASRTSMTEIARHKPLGLNPSGEAGFWWHQPEVLQKSSNLCCARCQAEWRYMEQPSTGPTGPSVRKTYPEKLKPTPTQERAVVGSHPLQLRLEQQITWWRRGQGRSVSR